MAALWIRQSRPCPSGRSATAAEAARSTLAALVASHSRIATRDGYAATSS